MRWGSSAKVGNTAVTQTRLAFEQSLGWIVREQSTADVGIDAQAEVVEGETATGRLLGLQIKGGKSWFKERGPGGWWYRPTQDHVEYWLNHPFPVVVVLYDPESERCYWQFVDAQTLESVPGGGWKLLVPKENVLDKTAREPLTTAAAIAAPGPGTTIASSGAPTKGSVAARRWRHALRIALMAVGLALLIILVPMLVRTELVDDPEPRSAAQVEHRAPETSPPGSQTSTTGTPAEHRAPETSPTDSQTSTTRTPAETAQEENRVSASWAHSCAIQPGADGRGNTATCWGDNTYGQAPPPAEEFLSISAGVHYTCGIRVDKTVGCWGHNSVEQASPPAEEFFSISAGVAHTCGIRVDNAAACWGDNSEGQASPQTGEFLSISADGSHTCGIRIDNTVDCWGDNSEGQASPQTGEFLSISAGWQHTCGIRVDKTVDCWGHNSDRQASPPAGEFLTVSADAQHTCGIRVDKTVDCWGHNSDRRASPPAGEFLTVSAGGSHTCGIGVDKTVDCWGQDTVGQSSPPNEVQ